MNMICENADKCGDSKCCHSKKHKIYYQCDERCSRVTGFENSKCIPVTEYEARKQKMEKKCCLTCKHYTNVPYCICNLGCILGTLNKMYCDDYERRKEKRKVEVKVWAIVDDLGNVLVIDKFEHEIRKHGITTHGQYVECTGTVEVEV